jgi:hypothetical protein
MSWKVPGSSRKEYSESQLDLTVKNTLNRNWVYVYAGFETPIQRDADATAGYKRGTLAARRHFRSSSQWDHRIVAGCSFRFNLQFSSTSCSAKERPALDMASGGEHGDVAPPHVINSVRLAASELVSMSVVPAMCVLSSKNEQYHLEIF